MKRYLCFCWNREVIPCALDGTSAPQQTRSLGPSSPLRSTVIKLWCALKLPCLNSVLTKKRKETKSKEKKRKEKKLSSSEFFFFFFCGCVCGCFAEFYSPVKKEKQRNRETEKRRDILASRRTRGTTDFNDEPPRDITALRNKEKKKKRTSEK